jgi:hypothetical protein
MAKRTRRAVARKKKKKKKVSDRLSFGGPLLDDQVLTFREWCALNGISVRTGRRIIDGPDPPAIVRLSARRIGITVKANREWQARRALPTGEVAQ